MKKIIASVLSLVLAVSSSAFMYDNGTVSAVYGQDQTYSDNGMDLSVSEGCYEGFFDSDQNEYVNWYTLQAFSSSSVTAAIPQESDGRIISEISQGGCDCSGIQNLFLPKKLKIIQNNGLINTQSLKYLTIPENVTEIGEIKLPDNITIRGYQGSFAQAYADKKGYNFEAMGDADANGSVSVSDLMFVRKYLLNTGSEMTDEQFLMSDFNMDGKVNILDYIMTANALMNDTGDMFANPNISAVAAPDYSTAKKVSGYTNEAFNEFTAKTVSALYKDSDTKNEVCSPLSLYMALSQAAECTDSQTLAQFLDVLGVSSLEELREGNSSLFGSLYYDELSRYMKIANSIWINNKYTLENEPLDILSKDYFTAVFWENFADSEAEGKKISKWISMNTGGKFEPDITVDPDNDIMKIINTVNFKDSWTEKFSPARENTFTKNDGTEETCGFLGRTYDQASVGFGDDYMKFSVGMKDNYQMNFVLPDEDATVNSIISDTDTMNEIIDNDVTKKNARVIFSVPKFNVRSSYDFVGTAKELGITDAFSPAYADFGRIMGHNNTGVNAYITDISHEAAIQINEDGCEAAAYTMISCGATCAPPDDDVVDFELDRPFIYYVSDSNGTPVFMGIINDPNEQ